MKSYESVLGRMVATAADAAAMKKEFCCPLPLLPDNLLIPFIYFLPETETGIRVGGTFY